MPSTLLTVMGMARVLFLVDLVVWKHAQRTLERPGNNGHQMWGSVGRDLVSRYPVVFL